MKRRSISLPMLASALVSFAIFAPAAYAQGYATKGKDGATVYSNKPPEAAPASPMEVLNPSGADVATYALTGATLEDAQKDAALKSPLDPATGKHKWSNTTWSAAWNYWTKQEAESCRIDVVSVRLKIATQLPAWTAPKDAPTIDQCRWDAFSQSLRKSEEARAAAALRRARELERAILALPARPRCDAFSGEIDAMGKKLLDDGRPVAAPAAAPAVAPIAARPPLPPQTQPAGQLMAPGTIVPNPGGAAKVASRQGARPANNLPPKAVPPPPPKPLAIPKAIYDACKA